MGPLPHPSWDTKNLHNVPWPQRLPIPSSAREGFGLFLIHHILCAGPEAHLKFLIPVDAPCGEHLAGWHTF